MNTSYFQNYKNSIAKTLASKAEKKSSLLALNGIQKETKFGIRTVLDELDAEVEYLNASANLIKSEAEQIQAFAFASNHCNKNANAPSSENSNQSEK